MDFLEYVGILQEARGEMHTGRLKLSSTGLVFKNNKTGKIENIIMTDIDSVSWLQMCGGFGLRVVLKTGQLHLYAGFKRTDYEKLTIFFCQNKVDISEKELSTKGWNWGTAIFSGSILSFEVNNATAFEIPLKNVYRCSKAINEVAVDFHQNDADVSLTKMKFYIPSSNASEGPTPLQDFYDKVMKVAGEQMPAFKDDREIAGRYDSKALSTSNDNEVETNKEKTFKKVNTKKFKSAIKSLNERKPRKNKRNENQPHRPQSAFFLWLNENREKLKKEFPGITTTELSKKAGERWKEIKDKIKYEKLAEIGKKDYEKAMAEYKASGRCVGGSTDGGSSSQKSKKRKKVPKSSSSVKSKEYILSSSGDSSSDFNDGKIKKQKSKLTKDESDIKNLFDLDSTFIKLIEDHFPQKNISKNMVFLMFKDSWKNYINNRINGIEFTSKATNYFSMRKELISKVEDYILKRDEIKKQAQTKIVLIERNPYQVLPYLHSSSKDKSKKK